MANAGPEKHCNVVCVAAHLPMSDCLSLQDKAKAVKGRRAAKLAKLGMSYYYTEGRERMDSWRDGFFGNDKGWKVCPIR